METKDGLPVYRVSRHDCWTDDLKEGNAFYYVTKHLKSGEEHMFKLVRTENEQEDCSKCLLDHYSCQGIGCCIKEVK